jgi:hypothetical protein
MEMTHEMTFLAETGTSMRRASDIPALTHSKAGAMATEELERTLAWWIAWEGMIGPNQPPAPYGM